MAADLGLVADAAHRHAHEPAAERPRDRVAERGLADSGRPDEAEDLPRDLVAELRHGEVLDDALLHLLEVEVVLVEHLAGMVEVEVVLGRGVPRERLDPLQVVANDAVLRRRGRQSLEPAELAVDGLADLLGQRERREALAKLVHLGELRVALAELLLDRLQLLAQEVLALALLHLRLHLRLDLRAELEHLDLAREDRRDMSEPLLHVGLLQEPLALLGRDRPQRRGDEMGERARVVDVRRCELELCRQVRSEPDDLGEERLDVPGERLDLRGVVVRVGLGG